MGPNELFSGDLDVLRRLSSSKSPYTRGGWYRTFRFIPSQDNSFSLLDEAKHSMLRSQLGPGYSNTKTIESNIENQVSRLVSLIDSKFLSTDKTFLPIEFDRISLHFALDVIGDINFGSPFGFLDQGKDPFGYIDWFERFFQGAMVASTFPWLVQAAQYLAQSPLFSWMKLFPRETDEVGMGRFTRCANAFSCSHFIFSILISSVVFEFALLIISLLSSIRQANIMVSQRLQAMDKVMDDADYPRDMVRLFKAHGVTRTEIINEILLQM